MNLRASISDPRCARQAARPKSGCSITTTTSGAAPSDELSNPEAYEYIDGIAWHGYVGEPTAMTRVHEAFPQKNAYWTEGGPDINQPDYETDYTKWADTYNGILNNWARSITAWNLVLDENGKPNVGPFSCGGVITLTAGQTRSHAADSTGRFAHYSQSREARRACCSQPMASAPRARPDRSHTPASAIPMAATSWSRQYRPAAARAACPGRQRARRRSARRFRSHASVVLG